MANRILLVNGLPGAGKTTLARALAPALGVPVHHKDTLKEELGPGSGRLAAERLWDLAAAELPSSAPAAFEEGGPDDAFTSPVGATWAIEVSPRRADRQRHPRVIASAACIGAGCPRC